MKKLFLALLPLAAMISAIPIDTLEIETRDNIPDVQIIVAFPSLHKAEKIERGYSNLRIPHQAESRNDIDGNNYGFFGSFNYYFGQHDGKQHGSGGVPWASATGASSETVTVSTTPWWWWETSPFTTTAATTTAATTAATTTAAPTTAATAGK